MNSLREENQTISITMHNALCNVTWTISYFISPKQKITNIWLKVKYESYPSLLSERLTCKADETSVCLAFPKHHQHSSLCLTERNKLHHLMCLSLQFLRITVSSGDNSNWQYLWKIAKHKKSDAKHVFSPLISSVPVSSVSWMKLGFAFSSSQDSQSVLQRLLKVDKFCSLTLSTRV